MRTFLVLPILLGSPLASHALLDDWLPDPVTFVGHDTVIAKVSSTNDNSVQRYVVTARDGQGRPLSSEYETLREGQDSYVSAYEFSWSFDLGWSPIAGVGRCPVRAVETRMIGPNCMREYVYDYAWNPDRRALVATATEQSPLCRWTDSITSDARGRVTEHRTCVQSIRSYSNSSRIDTLGHVTIRRMGYEQPGDLHPRWISEHDEDSMSWDSVHVIGPVDRPDGAELFDGGRNYTYMIGHDSIARDDSGRITSRRTRYHTFADPTEHPLELREYVWKNAVVEERRTRWGVRDSVIYRYLALYTYGSEPLGASHRVAPETAIVHRTPDGRLELDLKTAGSARIEWVALDGRRTTLHDGPALGTLRLRAPEGPALLRIRQDNHTATMRVPPF
jgi:hypothetical protein